MATKLTTELKDLDVDRVDGVDRPATGRAFALFKSEDNKGDDTMALNETQIAEIMKGYAALATASDLLLKAIRKDESGKINKSTAVALNGLAQIMGQEPVVVHKAVPTTPYELVTENMDGDKRGPADEKLGTNFAPLSMVGKARFTVKAVPASKEHQMFDEDPEGKDKKPALPFDEEKMAKMIEDGVAKSLKALGIEKVAAPVAKAEDKPAADKQPAPASKQVDLDDNQVKVRKDAGYRFGASFENVVFGK